MTPGNAIFATLLVPGSAHFVLGHRVRAVIAFAVIAGMFFAGYAILTDRLFHMRLFQPPEFLGFLTRIVPINLLPEMPNLGCSIVASLLQAEPENAMMRDDALRALRLARPMEHLGFWLTGSSGIVACLFAADAHGLALGLRSAPCNRSFAAGMSWLLPGAGHVLAGARGKGLLMGGAVIAMFVLGLAMSAWATVDRGHHDAYWVCQSLFGGGTLVAALGLAQIEIPNPIPLYYSLGFTLTAVAGLMNVVVMIDAWSVADRRAALPAGAGGPA